MKPTARQVVHCVAEALQELPWDDPVALGAELDRATSLVRSARAELDWTANQLPHENRELAAAIARYGSARGITAPPIDAEADAEEENARLRERTAELLRALVSADASGDARARDELRALLEVLRGHLAIRATVCGYNV